MENRMPNREHDFEDISETSTSPPSYEEAQQNSEISRRSIRRIPESIERLSHGEPHETSRNAMQGTSLKSNMGSSERRASPAILLMGATGAGKSSFIASATGLPVSIGHTLESHTIEPQGWKGTRTDGTNITLIDTPGFNDTKRPDTELLTSIIGFILQQKYQIISVIYIHAITERKFAGSTLKNLRVLRTLCGEHYFQNIVLVTSMWTKAPAEEMDDQLDREVQFNSSPQFWGDILNKGASYCRWDDMRSIPTARTAKEIVQICEKWDDAPKLALFLEMENGVEREDTEAYQVLTEQARKRQEREQCARRDEEEEMNRLRAQKAKLEAIAGREKEDCRRELGELRRMEVGGGPSMGQGGRGLRDIFSSFPRRAILRRRSESAASSMPLESGMQREVDQRQWFRGQREQSPSQEEHLRERIVGRSDRSNGESRYENGPERPDGRRSRHQPHHSGYEIVLVRRKRK